MQNAMWLASIFGPFLMILGIWMLFYRDNMMKVCNSIKSTPGLLYFSGILNLLIGLIVISEFSFWSWGLTVLVTLLGWALLVRGLMIFFLPQFLLKKTMGDGEMLRVKGVIILIWGFGLTWLAFWM
jgi:hypothetical protein